MTEPSKLPPQDRAAERSVLGSMLRDNGAIDDVAAVLTEGAFYADAHRKIFRGALALRCAANSPVDLVTLADWLKQQGFVEDVGGYKYLAELWDAAPTAANALYYARIVRDKATLRSLIRVGTEILQGCYEQTGPADELLEAAEREIFAIADVGFEGQAVPLKDPVREACDRFEAAARNELPEGGLPTGYLDLDAILSLRAGELTLVAARPGVGKSAFLVNLLDNLVAGQNAAAALFSLEMTRAELAERLLACRAGVDSRRMRRGLLDEDGWAKLSKARAELWKDNVFIDDTPGQTPFRILAGARRLRRRHDTQLVLVDYVQLIEGDRGMSEYERISAASRYLKLLARDLNIPVVAAAQLNRDAEDRQRPRLRDLKGSGSLEQDADNVILLHKDEANQGVLEVIVAKQRNGPVGDLLLTWHPERMRFENYAVEPGSWR